MSQYFLLLLPPTETIMNEVYRSGKSETNTKFIVSSKPENKTPATTSEEMPMQPTARALR